MLAVWRDLASRCLDTLTCILNTDALFCLEATKLTFFFATCKCSYVLAIIFITVASIFNLVISSLTVSVATMQHIAIATRHGHALVIWKRLKGNKSYRKR